METYSEALTDKLNSLLTTLYDGEKGYAEAAEQVENTTLQTRFKELSQQRYDFGHELKAEMKKYGVKPNKGTSVVADIHRVWMNIRTAITNNEEEVLLQECVRGESNAVDTYEDILADVKLPETSRSVLTNQLQKIRQAYAAMKVLREAYAVA